jgi:hypothetical protein
MGRQRLSIRGLAIILGWTPAYLARRLSGQVAFSTDDIAELAIGLHVSLHVLTSPRAS